MYKSSFTAIALALFLSACGGGGGESSTAPVANVPTSPPVAQQPTPEREYKKSFIVTYTDKSTEPAVGYGKDREEAVKDALRTLAGTKWGYQTQQYRDMIGANGLRVYVDSNDEHKGHYLAVVWMNVQGLRIDVVLADSPTH